MNTVGEQISRLRISTMPFETVYLNEPRVHDHFLAQLGTVREMVWSAEKKATGEGSIDLVVAGIKGGGEASSAGEISFDLSDAVGRALVLRNSLAARGLMAPIGLAAVGQYVQISGYVSLQRGQEETVRGENFLVEDQRIDRLETEREQCEEIDALFGGSDGRMWLAVLAHSKSLVGAAVCSEKYVKRSPAARFRDWQWTIFGTLQRRFDDIPLVTVIHAWVDLPSGHE